MMMEQKYIGLILAVLSAASIGSSFVITKMGLMQANKKHGFEGDGFLYLKSPIWWCGNLACVFGEVLNAAAYTFAPAILVTPLGAFSVLIGAVLGASILGEKLGILGKMGCAICLLGSLLLVLHAPAEREIQTIDEVLDLAKAPLFLLYLTTITVFAVYMIFVIAPVRGKTNPLIYISICSSVGSVAVMAVKAVGIAVRLTISGSNQLVYPSTYIFAIVLVVCLLVQTAYINKAMNHFPTSLVNALYYVAFTTCTLSASFILFGGINTSDPVNNVSLLAGFLAMLAGVYLLTMFRPEIHGNKLSGNLESTTGSIDDLRRQILSPWRDGRHSLNSIDSRRTDLEGLLHSSGEIGSTFELTSLDGHQKMTGEHDTVTTNDENPMSND